MNEWFQYIMMRKQIDREIKQIWTGVWTKEEKVEIVLYFEVSNFVLIIMVKILVLYVSNVYIFSHQLSYWSHKELIYNQGISRDRGQERERERDHDSRNA